MLIKPLSAIAASDDPAINTVNYPGLKFALNPSALSANGLTFTSLVGGIAQTFTSASALSGDGTYIQTHATAMPASGTGGAGTIPGPSASQKVLLLYIGGYPVDAVQTAGDCFGLGDPVNGPGIALATHGDLAAGPLWMLKDAANYLSMPVMTKNGIASTYGAMALTVDVSGGAGKMHVFDADVIEVAPLTAGGGTIVGAWGNIAPGGSSTKRFQLPINKRVYGAYMFYLSALPTDAEVQSILAWMYANPTRLHPNLIGRA